jgi:transposase
MPGPSPCFQIKISAQEEKKLKQLQRSWKKAHGLVLRATIILLLSLGLSISQVSKQTNTQRNTVRKWGKRYILGGIPGISDTQRPGRPPVFSPDVAMHIIKIACEMPQLRGRSLAQWDCAEIARELIRSGVVSSVSPETVRRILSGQKLKPWRSHMWLSPKSKRDETFCLQVEEIMDLYFRPLNPSECVICVDEKTSIQARKLLHDPIAACNDKPVLVEHEYERKGALNLLAAFDTRSGQVYGRCYSRKRQIEFIDFLEYLDRTISADITTINVICDNVSVHHGKKVVAWLLKNPRFSFHFTPVHCSWMNQVEQWFGILKRKRLSITHFESKDDLKEKLYSFIEQWNENAHAFKWNDKTKLKLETLITKIRERMETEGTMVA